MQIKSQPKVVQYIYIYFFRWAF